MSEEQRFLRFVLPGAAAMAAVLLGLFVVSPEAVVRIIERSTNVGVIGWAVTGLITSGALGFLFSQTYFGLLPIFNAPDHRKAPPCSSDGSKENRQNGDSSADACACRVVWDAFCSSLYQAVPCLREVPSLINESKYRHEAQYKAQYEWARLSSPRGLLRDDLKRSAARMASIGATALGLLVGLLVWAWLIFDPRVRSAALGIVAGGRTPSPGPCVAAGLLCFVLPFALLGRAHRKIRLAIEYKVRRVLEEGLENREAASSKSVGTYRIERVQKQE